MPVVHHPVSRRCVARRAVSLAIVLVCATCTSAPNRTGPSVSPARLASVSSWAIQLQGLERVGSQAALVAARADMVVIEPTRTVRGMEDFATRALVAAVTASRGDRLPRKVCIAYVNVGQAEDYRTYWQSTWRAPTAQAPGDPAFLLTLDPDGWPGNYPVAFWHPTWRAVATELIEAAARDGFAGAYLDWVLGFQEPAVVAAAARDGVEPTTAMVDLLAHLGARARAQRPDFCLIAQNAAGLVRLDSRFSSLVDAVAQEDLSFRGEAGAAWGDIGAGDIATPTADADTIAALLRECRAQGLAVFTLDYARDVGNAELARRRSRALGLVPCVSQIALDRLPGDAVASPPR